MLNTDVNIKSHLDEQRIAGSRVDIHLTWHRITRSLHFPCWPEVVPSCPAARALTSNLLLQLPVSHCKIPRELQRVDSTERQALCWNLPPKGETMEMEKFYHIEPQEVKATSRQISRAGLRKQ